MSPSYLVVDDSRLHHQMYDLIFARPALAGATVLHAFDGREGYAMFSAHPELTMVFLDLNMPVMTGLEFLARRRVDARHPQIPVVLVTTESSAEDEARGLAAGAWGYLRKPFQPEQLEAIVAHARRQAELVTGQ
ncbi:MAG TPA: response regulator [Gemmatimonadales bacterium]|jgi:two-component system chemotaxis response regulator CheY